MALQTSGAISISQLNAQFQRGNNLGSYRNIPWFTPQGGNGVFSATGLKLSDFYNKAQMEVLTAAHLTTIRNACVALYLSDPTIWFSVVANGNGNFGTLYDTRLQTGGSGVTTVTTGYNSLYQNVSYPAGDMGDLPRFFDGSQLRTMSLSDFIANFITPIGVLAYNPYIISTAASVGGYNLVSGTPIFIDTRAIANTDSATTIANYYLHRKAVPGHTDLNTMKSIINFAGAVDSNAQFRNLIKHCLLNVIGHRLRYNYNGAGTDLGTVMADTRLNSSTEIVSGTYPYQTTYYRPSGSAIVVNYYAFRGYQV